MKDSFYDELEPVFDKSLKCHMKILLRNFNAKVCRENFLNPSTGNDNRHETNTDNRLRVVKFATSRNLIVESTIFPIVKDKGKVVPALN
jgi:hypothetical protein